MRQRSVLFVIGKSYFQYVERICTSLESDSTIGLSLLDVADIDRRQNDLRAADLIVTVHSSVRNAMQAIGLLRGRVPSLTLQDGIIEYRSSARRVQELFRYRPLRTDYIAVFGDRSKRLLCAAGTEPERIFVTGSPRFDHYAQTPLPSDGYVLITMANRPAHKPARVHSFYNILSQTVSHCGRAGIPYKVRLSRGVRPGGVEAFNSTVNLDPGFADLLAAAAASVQSSLEEDLHGARAVITTPSTVSLEAMAFGRPVSHLLFDYETTFLQTAWIIRCQEDIADVVEQLVNPPKMKMEFQNVILEENLLCDGNSTRRVVDLIGRILSQREVI